MNSSMVSHKNYRLHIYIHTHTHTHILRERERRERSSDRENLLKRSNVLKGEEWEYWKVLLKFKMI